MKIVYCDKCKCLVKSKVKFTKKEIVTVDGERIPVKLIPYRYCKECGSYIYDPKFDDKTINRAIKKSKNKPTYFN